MWSSARLQASALGAREGALFGSRAEALGARAARVLRAGLPSTCGRRQHAATMLSCWMRIGVSGAVVFCLASCECSAPTRDSNLPLARQTAAEPPPIALDPKAPLEPTLAQDIGWRRAADGDAMDCARLGEREGAAALLARVFSGGRAAVVALCALPWASDAHAQRGQLCELLGRFNESGRELALRSLHAVLMESARFGEQLDAEADAVCRRQLDALDEGALSPQQHDLIVSIQRRLAWR